MSDRDDRVSTKTDNKGAKPYTTPALVKGPVLSHVTAGKSASDGGK